MKVNQRKAGVILSYAAQVVNILSGIIYTPIMLRILGQSEYGLYQLVNSVVSYLSLLSLGFGASYMRFYSRFKAKRDYESEAKLNGMFMVIFCCMSVICIICGIIMLTNITFIFGHGLTNEEYAKSRILMSMMTFSLALTFPNSVFTSIITAQEKFIFQKAIILLQSLLNPCIALPLLILGYGSVGIVTISTILTIVVLISNAIYCLKKLHSKFCFRGLDVGLLKEMWQFTFFIFLNQIIDQVNWSVDKFLLGRFAGTTAVAVYGVGAQLNALYLQFSTSVSNVFVPKVNIIVAETNDNDELTALFTKVGRIQFIIMTLILSGFYIFGKEFIELWAGDGYKASYYVALLLLTPVTIPLIQNLGIEIQRAKNKHQVRSIVYFLIAIVNVFISIPLIKSFGPKGAALGTTISLIMGNILFMNWYYHNYMGINMIYFWKNIISFIPGLIISIVIGFISRVFIKYDTLLKLVIGAIGYTIIFCNSMFFLGMNDYEKNLIIGFVKIRICKKD